MSCLLDTRACHRRTLSSYGNGEVQNFVSMVLSKVDFMSHKSVFVDSQKLSEAYQIVKLVLAGIVFDLVKMEICDDNWEDCRPRSDRIDGWPEQAAFELPQSKPFGQFCFLCWFPSRRASADDSICEDCCMDGRGYQITEQTPLVVDVKTYPVLQNHNVYCDYPVEVRPDTKLKFYCRTCDLKDDSFKSFLPLTGVYSRVPFQSLAPRLRLRLKMYRTIRSKMTHLESYLCGLLQFPVILQLRQTCRENPKVV